MTSQYGHGFPPIFFWWYVWSDSATQTNYTSKCSEFLFHHKNNITTSTFGLKSKENNENDMTSVVWAGTVFGPRLWPLSARRHSLADIFWEVHRNVWTLTCTNSDLSLTLYSWLPLSGIDRSTLLMKSPWKSWSTVWLINWIKITMMMALVSSHWSVQLIN